MSLEQAKLLVQEMGQKIGHKELELDDSGACVLRLKPRIAPTVYMQYIANGDYLLTYAELGHVPPDSEAELLRGFLEENMFWEESNGATYAINPDTAAVMLQRRDPVSVLTPSDLEAILDDFIASGSAARKRIALRLLGGEAMFEESVGSGDDDPDDDQTSLATAFMRV